MFWVYVTTTLLLFVGCLLMFIILLQRGRGGGLAGAFGGLGGQSAFGTKAGDVFTKITVVLAVIWVVLAGGTGFVMRDAEEGLFKGAKQTESEDPGVRAAPSEPDETTADAKNEAEEASDPKDSDKTDADDSKNSSKKSDGT